MRISRNPPASPPQPSSPSAKILALRSNWRWAYLSHFLFTYNPVLHLEDIQLSELEDDLATGTFEVIPTVMQRLLTSLTPHDKRMILDDWQHQLRKQCLRRAPNRTWMGTEDDPVDFASLIMTDKLDLFQSLCEWHFQNPNNLRARMRDDDEYANWRMEPIAYDAKRNAYWLMGGNRLWIQHAPPRDGAKSHKRKRPPTNATNGRNSKRRQVSTSARVAPANSSTSPKLRAPASQPTSGRPVRETRSRGQTATSSNQRFRTMGTRISLRLRGREEEDLWQAIPEEWLNEESKPSATEAEDEDESNEKGTISETKIATAMKSLDDLSELTSLSDLSDVPEVGEEEDEDEDEDEDDEDDVDSASTPEPSPSSSREEGWETVCVTLAEWEAFPKRFENATHRCEKAFYKLLMNDLVPMITEVLRVDVRKKVMEEAVVHRKRSSRIAVKESVREAERAEARRKAEAEKEMERHRRWEARARKEEEERIKRENMRSARLRERGRTGSESVDVDVDGDVSDNKPILTNGSAREATSISAATPVKFVVNASRSGTQTPKDDEPWELDCEICHRKGMNLDDGQELMCCENCNKWQHIRCHDQIDFIAGRPRRNWDFVDFLCSSCKAQSQVPKGSSSQPPLGSSRGPHNPVSGGSLGADVTPHDGFVAMLPQFAHGTQASGKSTSKKASSYDALTYSNGRTAYSTPPVQTPLPYPSAPPPFYTQTSTPPTSLPGHPAVGAPRSRALALHPAPTSYTPPSNAYLSHYSGQYRAPQNLSTRPHPQGQSSSPHYQPSIPVASRDAWLQPQIQFVGRQTWIGPSPDAGPQPYNASGTSTSQPQQPNGYRTHGCPAPNALAPLNTHHPSAQQYYAGGPASQS